MYITYGDTLPYCQTKTMHEANQLITNDIKYALNINMVYILYGIPSQTKLAKTFTWS